MTRCWAHKIDERPDISEVVDELLEILDSIPDMAHTTVIIYYFFSFIFNYININILLLKGLDDGGDALGSLMHK